MQFNVYNYAVVSLVGNATNNLSNQSALEMKLKICLNII